MHDAVDPKEIHSGTYSNANSARLSVQVTVRCLYIVYPCNSEALRQSN